MAFGDHVINNKKVITTKVRPRNIKLFIKGLTSDLSDSSIKNYFMNFGCVVEVQLVYDKVTNHRKDFGFITINSVETVTEILNMPRHTINGIEVIN